MKFRNVLIVLALAFLAAPAFAQTPFSAGMQPFSCFVENVSATTQCQGAPVAPFKIYITGMTLSNQVATAQALQVVAGTGSNCATAPFAVTHKIAMTTAIGSLSTGAPMVIAVPSGNAVCISPTAATAFGATLTGYIAP